MKSTLKLKISGLNTQQTSVSNPVSAKSKQVSESTQLSAILKSQDSRLKSFAPQNPILFFSFLYSVIGFGNWIVNVM